MQNYDNPAKNWVRSWYFAAIDRLFSGTHGRGEHAVYFPGVQNLEEPLYVSRGIKTYKVERHEKLIEKMSQREQVFHGTLATWIDQHAAGGRPRLSIVNADFEGQVDTCADEIIRIFRIFPARAGGLLCVTTFANMDPESVESGVVFGNAFDAILQGRVRPGLTALYDQMQPYLENTSRPDALRHAQFCRDFGVLWRVLMGLTLFTSPEQDSGELAIDVHEDLTRVLGAMHQTAGRIQALCKQKSFSFFHEPRLKPIMDEHTTVIFPLTIERVLYRSANNNRMTTWLIFFGRLRGAVPLTQVADQLWQLYAQSPLTVVTKSGRVHAYHSR